VTRFKTKVQVEVWHQKWDVLECEDDEDVSEYAIRFKKIYKQVNSHKSIPSRTIVRKFINLLLLKFVELLTIIKPANLNEVIKAVLDVKASQKVKASKWDQAYIIDTIKELW